MKIPKNSVGDDVLRWASETGSGKWVKFNEVVGQALATGGDSPVRPWQLAADMSALGHLDIDWVDGRWSAAPPCLVFPKGFGLCVYLAGWRTSSLATRFDEAISGEDVYPFDVHQPPAPRAMFAKCGSVEAAKRVAKKLAIPLVFDPAAALADLAFVAPHTRTLAAAPPTDESLSLFQPKSMTWVPVEHRANPGLYRFELHGRKVFRLLAEDWYVVDRAEGQLALLKDRDDLLKWYPSSRDMTTPDVLTVNQALSLPPLFERAAVSASGLLPHRAQGRLIYPNVSRSVAERLATRAGLKLTCYETNIQNWRS